MLLRARAGQGQGDPGNVLGGRSGAAAARVPLAGAVRARADLPRRRSGRPGDPDLAAARRWGGGVRRAREHPRRRARGSLGADRALRPWWLEEAPQVEPEPSLEGDLDVDVAIVGGGYTGLWTALAVRELEPSARVVVLEAVVCGEGPSGRNGGFLHGYWASLARARRVFGDGGALAVAEAASAIVPGVREFVERRGVDVWLREAPMLEVSAAPTQDEAIAAALSAARDLGVEEEAVPVGRDELAQRCSSPKFRRGVLYREGATVQPARLLRALRAAALGDGVVLHEGTPMVRLRRGSPNVVETPRGSVRAREVVIAINAAAAGWRPLARRLTAFGSYVVLTEPVPELLETINWTGGESIVDGRMFLHYFRTTNDGRVVMGSGSGPIGFGGRLDERFTADAPSIERAEAGLRFLLPGLAEAGVERAWGGPIDVSADHFPFFGTVPGSRVHYGAGYSGNGVGPSWLGGRILARLALGIEDELTALPLVGRSVRPLPPEPIKHLGGGLVRGAALRAEEAEQAGRRPALPLRAIAALPRVVGLRVGTR
ncbi:MAG: FAD-dependent oxidoreductase [Actinobacteria bacterium]|nr:MAG: FAD-dependent oxidoreductase [Actinomycetota bacterium]